MKRTGRVWAFFLGFFIGIVFLIGGVVGGGVLAYNYLKPKDIGIVLPGAGGEQGNLNDMSIKTLTEQLMRIYGLTDTYTINQFETDFGVDVSKLLGLELNNDIKSSPLLTVLSPNGLTKLLSSTKMGAVLGFAPGLFGQEVYDEISKFYINDLFNSQTGGFTNVLRDVKLGGIIGGYTYDATTKTYSRATAGFSLLDSFVNVPVGGAIEVFTKGQNIFEQIKSPTGTFYSVGQTPLTNIISGMDNIVGSKKIADMIDVNNNINPFAILDGLYIGSVLNLFKGECDKETHHAHNENCTFKWYKDKELLIREDKLIEVFANNKIDDILGGKFDIKKMFNGLKIGDLMGLKYECTDKTSGHTHNTNCVYAWYKNGVQVDDIMSALAKQEVSKLLDGTFEFKTLFEGMQIGTLMGFEKRQDGAWYKNGVKVDAIMNSLASTNVNALLDGTFKIDSVLGDNYVGDLMKYYKGDCKNKIAHTHTNDCEYEWFSDELKTKPLTDLEEALANISVKKLLDGTFKPSDMISKLTLGSVLTIDSSSNPLLIKLKDTPISKLSAEINTLTIADVIGLKLYDPAIATNDDPLFIGKYGKYDLTNKFTPDTAIINAIAGLTINNINGDTLKSAIDKLTLGDVLDLKNATGILAQLKDTPISSLTTAINDIKLGYAIGLYLNPQDNTWYTDSAFVTKATGINAKLADLSIKDLSSPGMLQTKIETLTLKDIGISASSGVLKQLEDTQIKDLSKKIDTIKLGHLLGLTFDTVSNSWKTSTGGAPTGLNAALADVTIADIANGGLTTKVNSMKLGDLIDMGANPIGILKLLKDTPINGISSKISTLKMGDVMNLYYNPLTSKWYNDSGFTNEASGITGALADMNINSVNGDEIMVKVKGLKVSDIFPDGGGMFNLIPKDTTISNLPTAISTSIQGATMNKLLVNGILSFDSKTTAGLDAMFSKNIVLDGVTVKEWKGFTITNLLTKLIDKAALMTEFISNTTKIAQLTAENPVTNATEIKRLQDRNTAILTQLNS